MVEESEIAAKLVVTEGEAAGTEFPLSGHVVFEIGRAQSSTITIPDKGVAMNHCRIYSENGIYTLYDLNTTKGTFINGEKISKQVLGDGDTIQLGPVLMVFWNPDGAPVVKETEVEGASPDADAPDELEAHWEDDTSREGKDTAVFDDETIVEDLPEVKAPPLRAPGGAEAKLTILEGPTPGTVFRLTGKSDYSIGRASEADVKIMDIKISRHHSRIALEDGTWYVLDCDSRNGTFLNGEQIRKHPLKDGDHVKVGFTIMQFDIIRDPAAEEPEASDSEVGIEMETKVAPEHRSPAEAAPKSAEPKTAVETRRKKSPGPAAAPRTLSCDLCGRELLHDDLASGLAVSHQGKHYCLTCVRKLQNLASGGAPGGPPPSPGTSPREDLNDSEIDDILQEGQDEGLFR